MSVAVLQSLTTSPVPCDEEDEGARHRLRCDAGEMVYLVPTDGPARAVGRRSESAKSSAIVGSWLWCVVLVFVVKGRKGV